jgi:hypothetical protein
MTSAQECQDALQKLAGRLSEMKAADREEIFGNRSLSVTIPARTRCRSWRAGCPR